MHEFHLSVLTVQDSVQEVCAHQERDVDAEPHRLSERDGLEAGAEPQQGAAHHTGGCGTGDRCLLKCRTGPADARGRVSDAAAFFDDLSHTCVLRSGDGGGDGSGVGLLGGGQRSGPGGFLHVLRSGHREHEGAGPGPQGLLRLPERSHHEAGGHHHLVSD